MNIDPISEIEIENDHIYLKPRNMTYEFIYRDASGIYWDKNRESLYNRELKDIDLSKWFVQILYSTMSEYNQFLSITPKTKWINVSDGLRHDLEMLNRKHRSELEKRYPSPIMRFISILFNLFKSKQVEK